MHPEIVSFAYLVDGWEGIVGTEDSGPSGCVDEEGSSAGRFGAFYCLFECGRDHTAL